MTRVHRRITPKNRAGFTIVEVIIVILLVSILAVNVVARFDGSRSFEPYTYRDQIIAALRLNQLKAMQQTSGLHCHQLLLTSSQLGVPDVNPCTPAPSFSSGWQAWYVKGDTSGDIRNIEVESDHLVTFTHNMGAGNPRINFDSLGRPAESCAGGCQITISNGTDTAIVKVEAEGYIHGL